MMTTTRMDKDLDSTPYLGPIFCSYFGPDKMVEVIEQMKKDGWLPVTPERQPYQANVLPQLRVALAAAGFIFVDAPTFKIGDVNYCVCTRRCRVDIAAPLLDDPTIFGRPDFTEAVIQNLRKLGATHVFQVNVLRLALYGLLPPTASVSIRSARVRTASALSYENVT